MNGLDELVVKRLATNNAGYAVMPFKESSGSALDILGNGLYGSVGAGVTRITDPSSDRYPYFFRFNRASNSIVVCNGRGIPTGSYTLKFSIRMSAKPTGENQEIISNAYARSTDAGIRIWVDTSGYICFSSCYKNSSYYGHTIYDTNFTFDNTWVDYMLTLDAVTRVVTLWKNGEILDTTTSRTPNNITPTYNLNIGRQPDTSYRRYFGGDLCGIEIYRKVLTPKDFEVRSSVIRHNNAYKVYNGVEWVNLDLAELSARDFLDYGMLSTSILDRSGESSPIDQLDGEIEMLSWTNMPALKAFIDRPTNGQEVIPVSNIQLLGLEKIDSLAIDGSASARVGFSLDGGVTWNAYIAGLWTPIRSISEGMAVSNIQQMPLSILNDNIRGKEFLKIGYYILPGEEITTTKITATIRGDTSLAPKNTHDIVYDNVGRIISITINAAGVYSVNFVDV